MRLNKGVFLNIVMQILHNNRYLVKWDKCFYISIKAHPHQNLEVLAGYHFFHLAEAKDAWYGPDPKYRRDKTGSSGKELGEELDLLLSYSLGRNLKVESGYSHFFPDNFLKKTGEHEDVNWFYFQSSSGF